MAWVRERVRHSAATIGTSESPGICPLKRVLESGGSSLDARPGTPASYGTRGSSDNYDSTPTTPTTSGSADLDNSFWGSSGKGPCATMLEEMLQAMDGDRVDSLRRFPGDAINNRLKGKSAAPKRTSESKRQKTRSQGSPNVELQQGRNSNALTNQVPVVDHQGVSQVKMTDSILFALVELRKQEWEWTLKLRSPSSVEAGVLFSVPKGQHAAPALCITDIITNSFYELREQGWEVHLQPHEGGNVELISEVCATPTGFAAQDKMKASNFLALSLQIGEWLCSSVMVKFSYAKQKLVWKVLEFGNRGKMEILWSDIDAMKATYSNFDSDTLEIHVSRPPSFFKGLRLWSTTPWSGWVACTDFTEGQACICKIHFLRFPLGVLKEHYEKLVQCDPRLKAEHIRGQACESFDGQGRWTPLPILQTLESDSFFEKID